MTRATFWSALLLAAMAAGSGCGTSPDTVGTAFQQTSSKPTWMANSEARVIPPGPADTGLVFQQGNAIYDMSVSMTGDGSVNVQQINNLAIRLVDDPLALLKHYVEVPYQLVWDLTTRSFYMAQVNYAANASGTTFHEANDLMVIVDRFATHFSGTIVQFNGIDHYAVDGQASIDQLNNLTLVQQDDNGTRAADFVAAMQNAPKGSQLTLSTAALLDKSPRTIIYIDRLGKPHLYQWQAPVGKTGLDALRRDR
ncbi:MAG TPA: hypothetical protein V6D05_14775 [Stenomitos sp.]